MGYIESVENISTLKETNDRLKFNKYKEYDRESLVLNLIIDYLDKN